MASKFDDLVDSIYADFAAKTAGHRLAKAHPEAAGVDADLRQEREILSTFRKLTETIKRLSAKVDHLSAEISQGNGLKRTAAQPDGDTRPEADGQATGEMRKAQAVRQNVLERALAAQQAGKISGRDVATIETCINDGRPVPPELLQVVVGLGTDIQ